MDPYQRWSAVHGFPGDDFALISVSVFLPDRWMHQRWFVFIFKDFFFPHRETRNTRSAQTLSKSQICRSFYPVDLLHFSDWTPVSSYSTFNKACALMVSAVSPGGESQYDSLSQDSLQLQCITFKYKNKSSKSNQQFCP